MMRSGTSVREAGTWLWILQRVTGVGMLLFVGLHIWYTHFALDVGALNAEEIAGRLQRLTFVIIDYGLLVFVMFHAMNGLRNVLLDFSFAARRRKLISWALAIVGVAWTAFGIWGLWPFIAGTA